MGWIGLDLLGGGAQHLGGPRQGQGNPHLGKGDGRKDLTMERTTTSATHTGETRAPGLMNKQFTLVAAIEDQQGSSQETTEFLILNSSPLRAAIPCSLENCTSGVEGGTPFLIRQRPVFT